MQLFLSLPNAKPISLDVSGITSIQQVKELVLAREGIPISEQRLYYSSTVLCKNDLTIDDYHIPDRSFLSMSFGIRGGVQILVKNIGKPVFPLEVELTDTVELIKHKIQQSQGIPEQEFRLTFRGKTLQNKDELQTISDLVAKGKATLMMAKTKEITPNSVTPADSEPEIPVLCVGNCGFYGSLKNGGYCSQCYKSKRSSIVTEVEVKQEPIMESSGTVQPIESPTQVNTSRCHKCNKKLGYLGFICKCQYYFCGTHRYHNEHNCTIDYKYTEQSQLRKQHCQVIAPKIDKI